MTDIGPGDIVECVARPADHPSAPWVFPPAVGSTWITRAVGLSAGGSRPLINLLGDGLPMINHLTGRAPGWPLACFRKVDGPPVDEEIEDEAAPVGREGVSA